MFVEAIKLNPDKIELKEIDDDKLALVTQSTDTSEIISMISAMLTKSNSQDLIPSLISLGDNKFVLMEAQLINDMPNGAFAIFEKQEDEYYLKAVIDLR